MSHRQKLTLNLGAAAMLLAATVASACQITGQKTREDKTMMENSTKTECGCAKESELKSACKLNEGGDSHGGEGMDSSSGERSLGK